MKEYLMKTITVESDEFGFIKASRVRDSNGYESIKITFDEQTIEIEPDDNGHYEQLAFELAKVIEAVAMDPCKLPIES